eukprot:CAMPEP_0202970170 /NCGR_PEP_ID=MMETSP1396-20130829/16163_1 /ASSEMBLY_ACC=CAM_ASM_000872 /TAXON_ID= /ORGANISM="Pseudokeronopsis sp., Strain Brazil" /LENGTH=70 /DNA_ID=CAMNT_0049698523 /DNA_START=673 /DNA_END=885 /DNA_ORIENTATION=+
MAAQSYVQTDEASINEMGLPSGKGSNNRSIKVNFDNNGNGHSLEPIEEMQVDIYDNNIVEPARLNEMEIS